MPKSLPARIILNLYPHTVFELAGRSSQKALFRMRAEAVESATLKAQIVLKPLFICLCSHMPGTPTAQRFFRVGNGYDESNRRE